MAIGPAASVPWRDVDLAAHSTCVHINGEIVSRGRGADVLGDPRNALTWLANQFAILGDGLRAGHMVTTGVTGRPCPIASGDRITADLGDLGTVSVQL